MEWLKLNDVCDVRDGTHDSPKYVMEGFPLVTSKNIVNGEINLTNVNLISEEDFIKINKRSKVDNGDILMPMIGTIGNPVIVKTEFEFAIKNVALIKFYTNSRVIPQYIYLVLESAIFKRYVEKENRGGTQKFLSLSNIRNFKFPVPSIEVQNKIINVLGKSKLLLNKRQSQITALDELTQSLFLEMFGDPTRNVKWSIKTFGEICDSKLGKMLDQKKQQEDGLLFKRYLGNRHVQWGRFVLDDLPLMGFKETELERYRVNKGDLLICEGGEVGRCAIWQDADEEIYYQKALHRAKIKTDIVTPEFLQNVMFIYAQRGGFKKYTTVATIAHLTAEKLNKLPIPIPSIELQNEFTLKNNAILQQREQLIKSKNELENLYSSILQKAFKGELFQD